MAAYYITYLLLIMKGTLQAFLVFLVLLGKSVGKRGYMCSFAHVEVTTTFLRNWVYLFLDPVEMFHTLQCCVSVQYDK